MADVQGKQNRTKVVSTRRFSNLKHLPENQFSATRLRKLVQHCLSGVSLSKLSLNASVYIISGLLGIFVSWSNQSQGISIYIEDTLQILFYYCFPITIKQQ